MPTVDNLDHNAPEIRDILGAPPRSIVRYGLSLIGVFALLLIGLSWWLRYPDTTSISCVLTADAPTLSLLVPANGRIGQLNVTDRQTIIANQPIVVLDNAASFESIIQVKKALSQQIPAFTSLPSLNQLHLGELQPYYIAYRKAHDQLAFFYHLRYHERKSVALTQKLNALIILRQNLAKQAKFAENDFRLGQRQFNIDSTLFERRGLTPHEFVNSERIYVREQGSYWQSKATLVNANVQLAELKQSIVELQLDQRQKERELTAALEESYRTLIEQLDGWERKYVIRSPIAGIITFNIVIGVNALVKAGDVLANVVPHKVSKIYCVARLPVNGSGKIAVGQRVQVRLDNYPASEFGTIVGQVRSIAITPDENGYLLQIRLPQGLRTSYGIILPYKPNITGTAEIITADRRLSERLLSNLNSLVYQSQSE